MTIAQEARWILSRWPELHPSDVGRILQVPTSYVDSAWRTLQRRKARGRVTTEKRPDLPEHITDASSLADLQILARRSPKADSEHAPLRLLRTVALCDRARSLGRATQQYAEEAVQIADALPREVYLLAEEGGHPVAEVVKALVSWALLQRTSQ